MVIRDLVNILILMINSLIILIEIYLIIMLINYTTNVFIRIIYNQATNININPYI